MSALEALLATMRYINWHLHLHLRVTQGHWKRNHWIDHTRLSSSRVIWRWILLWPWNVGWRSLKVIESGTFWKLGYGFLFAFHSNYSRIFSHFGDIQRQRMAWPCMQSGFGVRQGYWEWRGSIDHVWLSISPPLYITIALSCIICELLWRWIIRWPWNMAWRSLEFIETDAIQKLGCGFLFDL